MYSRQAIVLSIVAIAVSAGMMGCGNSDSSGLNLVTVIGEVTFDGKPIESGEVFFETDNDEHRGFAASIKDGSYRIQVPPGAMRVKITGVREVQGKFNELPGPAGEPPRKVPVMEAFVPAKYNDETTLRYEVPPKGASDANFALVP